MTATVFLPWWVFLTYGALTVAALFFWSCLTPLYAYWFRARDIEIRQDILALVAGLFDFWGPSPWLPSSFGLAGVPFVPTASLQVDRALPLTFLRR